MSGIELTITHDESVWVLRHADLTALDEAACRRETGFTISETMGFVTDTKPGLDTLAALEWLARRQNGEPGLRYEQVAAALTNGTAIDVDWSIPEPSEVDRPE